MSVCVFYSCVCVFVCVSVLRFIFYTLGGGRGAFYTRFCGGTIADLQKSVYIWPPKSVYIWPAKCVYIWPPNMCIHMAKHRVLHKSLGPFSFLRKPFSTAAISNQHAPGDFLILTPTIISSFQFSITTFGRFIPDKQNPGPQRSPSLNKTTTTTKRFGQEYTPSTFSSK